jgi:hypothetical protein
MIEELIGDEGDNPFF